MSKPQDLLESTLAHQITQKKPAVDPVIQHMYNRIQELIDDGIIVFGDQVQNIDSVADKDQFACMDDTVVSDANWYHSIADKYIEEKFLMQQEYFKGQSWTTK